MSSSRNGAAMPNPWAGQGRTLSGNVVPGVVVQGIPANGPPPQQYNVYQGQPIQQQQGAPVYYYQHPQQQHMQQQQQFGSPMNNMIHQMSAADPFWSRNIQPGEQASFKDFCLGCCCGPCCIGNPCSQQRKADYRRASRLFLTWVSFAQLILLIVALGMGGFAPSNLNPDIGPPPQTLYELGAKWAPDMRYKAAVWRFITPIFLHAGFIHLFFNVVLCQFRFLFLEKHWGLAKTAAVYIVSGIGASLMSCLLSPNSLSVGASGAIMGIFGCRIAQLALEWNTPPLQDAEAFELWQGRRSEAISLCISIVIVFLFGLSALLDNGAHLGGLLTGLMLGGATFGNVKNRIVPIVSGFLFITWFVVGFVSFYTFVKV